jgi:hypothetical protein
MLTLTRQLLKALLFLAPLIVLILVGVLAATWFDPDAVSARVGITAVTGPEEMAATRISLIWILLMTGLASFALHRLLLIVASASQGDPFVATNVNRLRQIGFALLGIELVRWLGALLLWLRLDQGFEENVEASLAVTPWLAILLTFVLARVFEVGNRLRDDAALTV